MRPRFFDGGRAFNGGNPPNEISFHNGAHVAEPAKGRAACKLILGATQKAWFKDQLRRSTATWKIWGNSEGALDWRSDPQEPSAWTDKGDMASDYVCLDE